MPSFDNLEMILQPWPLVIGGAVVTALVLLVLRGFILSRLRKITSHTRYTLDSVLVTAIGFPLTVLSIAALVAVVEALLIRTGLFEAEIPSIIPGLWYKCW